MNKFPYEQNALFFTGLALVFFALLNMTIGSYLVFTATYVEYLFVTGSSFSPLAMMITKQLSSLYIVLNLMIGLIGVHFMFKTKKKGMKY